MTNLIANQLKTALTSSLMTTPGEPQTKSPREETAAKIVYCMIAFLEIGLHPYRGDTKYEIDDFRLKPMVAKDYYFWGLPIQGLIRTLTGASQSDLKVLVNELMNVIDWYVWDEKTREQAIIFLEKVVTPGFDSLQQITYKKDQTSHAISLWKSIIKQATKEPWTKESFIQNFNNLGLKEGDEIYDIVIERIHALPCPFGESVKKLVTPEKLAAINKIFLDNVQTRDSEMRLTDIEALNRVVIHRISEEIDRLHKDYKDLHRQATAISLPQNKKPKNPPTSKPIQIPNGQESQGTATPLSNGNTPTPIKENQNNDPF